MTSGRRKTKQRRNPAANALDLRLDPRDRSGGAPADVEIGEEVRILPRRNKSRAARRGQTAEATRIAREDDNTSGAEPPARRSLAARLAYWLVVLALWVVIAAVGTIVWVAAHLPAIQSLEVPKRPPSIEIVGLGGRVLATRGDMGGAAVPLKELPAYLPKAFIAIEDRRFYEHGGIDPMGVLRAALANLLHRGLSQGGSTITQQLAKNLFLTQERTFERKIQEVVLALWLEHKFSKAQILDLYLNRVYFGSGAYGVEAAAQRYFGKSARQVTLAEAALLAGLVKSPSRLAPTRNPNGAERRAQIVLAAMAEMDFISDDAAKTAITQAPHILSSVPGGSGNYVADWVMDVLNDLIGHVEQDIVVETSIDPPLQSAAEQSLVDELAQKGDKFGVTQGAIVAMSPDGAVRAMVGGRSYTDSQFNRAVAARRQPGSAFKPFVYLAALERGLTPESVREDRPIDVKGWRPENFSHEYFGPVTLRSALSLSLNTVAVRLALEVGPQAVVRAAHRLGITSKLDPNPSIALGTSEVSPLELTSAYAPFANGGLAVVPHVVDRVRGTDGKLIYWGKPVSPGRIIDPRYVAMMNVMMQETLLTGTARRADLPGWQAAGKTGTSQDFRDAWFVGYTGHMVTGIWLGNDDNSPTHRTTGSSLPVEIWSRFMKVAHRAVPPAELPGLGWPGGMPPPAPIPNGPQVATAPDPNRFGPPAGGGLDGWLIDRLFGRR